MDLSTYSATDHLRDGTPLQLRAIRPDDKQALLDGFQRLSGRSVYFRFMGPRQELGAQDLRYFTEVDFIHHIAIVAALQGRSGEQPIGVGRLIEMDGRPNERAADIAFAVEDKYQSLGAGTALFGHIVRIAQSQGFTRLLADVHTGNRNMLEIFRRSGFAIASRTESGVEHIELDITRTGNGFTYPQYKRETYHD